MELDATLWSGKICNNTLQGRDVLTVSCLILDSQDLVTKHGTL